MSLRTFVHALQFLTRLPAPALSEFDPKDLSRSAVWFPVVGLIVGGFVAFGVWAGGHVSPWVGALIGLIAWIGITGALHLDGLGDVADGLGASHRDPARFLGVLFIVPFAIFLFQKRLPRKLAWPLFGLFVLGGFQGALGWWMVSSGLTELTSVSQYRLAAHLTAASLLFIALIYVARSLSPGRVLGRVTRFHMTTAVLLLVSLILQIGAGAFVAGLDAGMGYQTWPLMDGAIIPGGLFAMDPAWRNLFENALTVQFIHRGLAYLIVAYVAYLIWRRYSDGGFGGVHGWLPRIGAIVLLQVGLGIATLLMSVPIGLAVGHQALAFMLIGMVAAYLADMKRISAR